LSADITKSSIDLGIVANDIDAMMTFYEKTLGLPFEGSMPMPGGGTMNRFKAGDSVIKIISLEPQATAVAAPGGIRGATGYRYWTITVSNLSECIEKAEAAGAKIIVKSQEVRPGIIIAILADPDGNWVEILQIT
jgi:predicted enzyme related to lactoylglutathione lyase